MSLVPIPDEINVLGYMFKVERHSLDDEDEAGHAIARERIIRIDDGLCYSAQVEVFYHELLHIMMDHLGIDNLLSPEAQEVFAQSLGMTLAYVISANELPTIGSSKQEQSK